MNEILLATASCWPTGFPIALARTDDHRIERVNWWRNERDLAGYRFMLANRLPHCTRSVGRGHLPESSQRSGCHGRVPYTLRPVTRSRSRSRPCRSRASSGVQPEVGVPRQGAVHPAPGDPFQVAQAEADEVEAERRSPRRTWRSRMSSWTGYRAGGTTTRWLRPTRSKRSGVHRGAPGDLECHRGRGTAREGRLDGQ